MIDTINYVLTEVFPAIVSKLSNLFLTNGVSLLSFIIALTLLCILIGSLLFKT